MEITSCSRRVNDSTCSRSSYFFLLFPAVTISLQCDANSIQQVLVAKWFGQEFDCPRLHSANTHRNDAVGGDKDYRNTNVSRCKLALIIESAQFSREPNIEVSERNSRSSDDRVVISGGDDERCRMARDHPFQRRTLSSFCVTPAPVVGRTVEVKTSQQ
jgi:hypothetical protein